MLKITREAANVATEKIFLPEIPIGTTFYAKLHRNDESARLFLRMYGGIVDLENPRRTWGQGSEVDTSLQYFDLFEYRPVDIVGTVKEISR